MRIDIAQLEFIDKQLRDIATWLEDTGLEFTITSLFRPDDEGVHGTIPLRGIDLRMRNQGLGEHIVREINEYWQYDHKRESFKCAILHGKGASLHIHIQTHPNTIKRA